MPINTNAISLAGEFATLSQLALQGYDANLTLGNTKGVDILVSDPRGLKMYQLEVKTNYRNRSNKPQNSALFGKNVGSWILNQKHEQLTAPNLFYCFVNISRDTGDFRFFIVPSRVVAHYVRDSHHLWLKSDKKHKDQSMRHFRLGYRGEKYLIATPRLEDYENNWAFSKH